MVFFSKNNYTNGILALFFTTSSILELLVLTRHSGYSILGNAFVGLARQSFVMPHTTFFY
jgi:hypothetical protein